MASSKEVKRACGSIKEMTEKSVYAKKLIRSESITIPEGELVFSFARSGGPGGQNVNKVETKVSVTFAFVSSKVLTWEEKGRLSRHPLILQNMDSEGALTLSCQTHRSQLLNREEVVRKLHDVIRQALRPKKKRIPTKKTKSSERERLASKKVRSKSKASRRRVDHYGDE